MESTYSTSQVAKRVGLHPNTVRMYEALELIPKPLRKTNGYRVFTEFHIAHFRLARTAFQIEVLQNGLRRNIVEVVKRSVYQQYDEAIALTHQYIQTVREEIANANEAVEITKGLLQHDFPIHTVFLKRKDVSDRLGISMDTLRNWEMNGLLDVKRKENGYRVYTHGDMQKLKIIRSLRCANYSLSAILRMLKAVSRNAETDIEHVLNVPEKSEDIVSVCDKLILSLNTAEKNAEQMVVLLHDIKNKYANPPL